MTEAEKLKTDWASMKVMKICTFIIQTTNLYFMLLDTMTDNYEHKVFLYTYWACWIAITILVFVAEKFDRPHLYRITTNILMIRNILPWFNLENRATFKDIGKLVQFNQLQTLGLIAGVIIPVTIYERPAFYIPVTLVYQISISYGLVAVFYQIAGVENYISYVYQKKIGMVLMITFFQSFVQYVGCFLILFFRTQLNISVSELQIAKLSLKVIMNHLNSALIIRQEDGTIGYCNKLGLNIIEKACQGVFPSESKLKRYLSQLTSMDFLTQNFFNRTKSDSEYQQEKTIMNAPLLKLHIKQGSGQ